VQCTAGAAAGAGGVSTSQPASKQASKQAKPACREARKSCDATMGNVGLLQVTQACLQAPTKSAVRRFRGLGRPRPIMQARSRKMW
jgi:hypothetical protein